MTKSVSDDKEELYSIGDKLYRIGKDDYIDEVTIITIKHYPHTVYKDDHGHSYFNSTILKNCFKTKGEAILEIERRQKIKQKRKLLKDYEIKLNTQLGIKNHFIIK